MNKKGNYWSNIYPTPKGFKSVKNKPLTYSYYVWFYDINNKPVEYILIECKYVLEGNFNNSEKCVDEQHLKKYIFQKYNIPTDFIRLIINVFKRDAQYHQFVNKINIDLDYLEINNIFLKHKRNEKIKTFLEHD